jgi:hypothetical protein
LAGKKKWVSALRTKQGLRGSEKVKKNDIVPEISLLLFSTYRRVGRKTSQGQGSGLDH